MGELQPAGLMEQESLWPSLRTPPISPSIVAALFGLTRASLCGGSLTHT